MQTSATSAPINSGIDLSTHYSGLDLAMPVAKARSVAKTRSADDSISRNARALLLIDQNHGVDVVKMHKDVSAFLERRTQVEKQPMFIDLEKAAFDPSSLSMDGWWDAEKKTELARTLEDAAKTIHLNAAADHLLNIASSRQILQKRLSGDEVSSLQILQEPPSPDRLKLLSDLSHLGGTGGGCSGVGMYGDGLSITSRWMSKLMSFRNTKVQSVWDKVFHGAKVAMTEVALPFLTVAAAVETAVRTAIHSTRLLKGAYQVGKEVGYTVLLKDILKGQVDLYNVFCRLMPKKLESASFTIRWSAKMLSHNLSFTELPETEAQAKEFLK